MIKVRNNGNLYIGTNTERILNFNVNTDLPGTQFYETDTTNTYMIYSQNWTLMSVARAYGGIYANSPVFSVTTTTTPQKITGFTNDHVSLNISNDFNDNKVNITNDNIYIGIAQCSFIGDNNRSYTHELYVNGNPSGFGSSSNIHGSNKGSQLSILAMGNLVIGDFIEIYVSSDASATYTLSKIDLIVRLA